MKRTKQFLLNVLQARVSVPIVLTLMWAASVLFLPYSFLLGAFSTAYLLLVPGYSAYRTIVGYPRNESNARALGYVVGLSVISLMVLGLGVNQILLAGGNQRPLTLVNLTVVIAGFSLMFSLFSALRDRPQRQTSWYSRYLTAVLIRHEKHNLWLSLVVGAFLVLLPLLAIGGANTLNNGGSGLLALMTVALVAVVIAALAWTNDKRLLALYPLGLYAVTLAILLGTSMRGWAITGHDVMQEFQVFQLTSVHSQWNMSFYQDAYTACLSITILPVIFQRLTGISDPYVFKFIFQVIFAIMAPILYAGVRPSVSRKMAFLGVVVFITFPTFLTDIMMLNRQEIAFLCFGLAIAAGSDKRLSSLQRHLLLIIFLGGMVLAHYSTSYVAVATLIIAILLGVVLFFMRPLTKRWKFSFFKESPFSIFPPYIVALVLAMVIGWSGLATHTAGNISQTLTSIEGAVSQLVTHTPAPKTPTTTTKTHLSAFDQFVASARQTRSLPVSDYYSDAVVSDFAPVQIPEMTAPVSSLLKKIHVPGTILNSFYGLIRQAYIGLLALLLGIGLLVMMFRRGFAKLPPQYALLGIASLLVVVLQVVLPSGAIDYGLARVIQQSLIVLALPAAVALVWLCSRLKLKYVWRFRVAAAVLVLLFLILSSFVSTLTGGYKPALAFSNSGFYYEAYYTHTDEIEADKWLVVNAPKGSRVYSDEFARRKMIAYSGIFSQPTLIPAAFPVDSYVYLSDGNMTFNEVPAYANGNLVFYSVPTNFLNVNKNLLYNSGRVLIYK